MTASLAQAFIQGTRSHRDGVTSMKQAEGAIRAFWEKQVSSLFDPSRRVP
ncbi:hypothetical protein J2Y55_001561 [Bosea sp. BE125]|nr:hypothetical protein [Bosea sp. BE125]MDR6870561.1 hypothetical protein [Bosea sp. BE125]